MSRAEPFKTPFQIIVDGREKKPYTFQGLRADAKLNRRPIVADVSWGHLKTGDYSLKGCENLVTVERKSKADLYATLGQHRERFEAEHQRMAELGVGDAIVVIESDWEDILKNPPERSRLEPKVVHRTAISWLRKYGIPWMPLGSRRLAEITTFRFLERFWYELQAHLSERSGECRICGKALIDHKSMERGMGPVCAAKGDGAVAERIKAKGGQG